MKVRKIRLVIENYKKKKEDGKYLEGIRKIGEEIFEAIDLSYSDMDEIPTGYYEIMDLIDEAYDKGDFDEAVDMMYLLAYLCDDISRLKVEAFACMSESTKEAISEGFVTAMRTETDDEWNMYFDEDEGEENIDNIKLTLQGYNFGNGLISWAKEKYGGYSEEAAREFSEMMAEHNGWSSDGDIDYVAHVTRYYPQSSYSYGMMYYSNGKLGIPVEGMTKADIISPFGRRWGTIHMGTDFGYPTGTPIYASESGTVTVAGWYGRYGKCVIIDHGNGMQTLYAHQNKVNVAKGQKVVRGQCIGETGNTGNSTGPHLHFEVIINGKAVDPMKGYLNMS